MRRLIVSTIAFLLIATAWTQPRAQISGGPMVSWTEMTEVAVWVQLTADTRNAQLRYWPKGNRGQSKTTPNRTANEANDHAILFVIPGLEFGTQYEYEVLIDSLPVPRGYPMEFKTQPHWRFRSEPPEFTIALGSCSYISDAPFDRPGRPYGGDYEIFTAIDKQNPDLMLWLGDNDYYREPDWLTESAMRNRWRTGRKLPELQPLLARTAHYAIWDDHDYGPNDSDRSFRLKDEALKVFSDYWPSVTRGTSDVKGCFFRFEYGDCEFFMLDDRYHRSPNNAPASPDKVMFGKAQMQWLKDSLLNSRAPFKFICNGNQMIQPMVFYEGFKNFPFEQTDLFDFIATSKIEGVVFLTGDRHATELLKVQWTNAGYPWYEYTSSPLTSGGARDEREANNPARVPGTWVTQKRNFGLIKVGGKRGERKLTLTAHDKDGIELWRYEISEKELKIPR